MKCRAYTRPDGGVSVVTFSEDEKLPKETDQEFMDRMWCLLKNNDPKLPDDYIDIEPKELPDRKDRDNWKIKGDKIYA